MGLVQLKQESITSGEVAAVLSLVETIQALERRVCELHTALDPQVGSIISRLDAGADTSGLGFDLFVRELSRRSVAWREVAEKNLGAALVEKVLSEAPVKTHRFLTINGRKVA
ncbi:hypothetical protein WDW37_18195 [Bdellovibrionota bacterium FG-1]